MKISLIDMIRELARRHVIDEQAREAPQPETQAEQDYLDLARWTDDNQFKVFRNGKQIHPPK